jgi:hypothetical protein
MTPECFNIMKDNYAAVNRMCDYRLSIGDVRYTNRFLKFSIQLPEVEDQPVARLEMRPGAIIQFSVPYTEKSEQAAQIWNEEKLNVINHLMSQKKTSFSNVQIEAGLNHPDGIIPSSTTSAFATAIVRYLELILFSPRVHRIVYQDS